MSLSVKFNCLIIILSRLVDLYSTKSSLVDFQSQETNFLVKLFNLNFFEFCIVDILLAIALVIIYIYSIKNSVFFAIQSSSFFTYCIVFLYIKRNLNLMEYAFSMSFKRAIILFGSIIPQYILITSLIFTLNNIWVNQYVNHNTFAIESYHFFNSFYFFDFTIYVLPVFILIYFLRNKLKRQYYLHNK